MLQIPTPEFYALKAKLTRKASGALGRRSFLRVYAYMEGGEFYASPIRVMGSSIISTMSRANGYVIIPEDRGGLERGEMVTVYLFDYLGGKRNV